MAAFAKLGPNTHTWRPVDCAIYYWWNFIGLFPNTNRRTIVFEETNSATNAGSGDFFDVYLSFFFVLTIGKEIAKDYLLPTKITK